MNPSIEKVNSFPELQPGDILLYGDSSPLSWAIRFRTWSDVSHVEVYVGDGRSIAARSDGFKKYPLRLDGLRRVIRPAIPFNFKSGMEWFAAVDGTKYGWADLLRFYLVDVPTKGLICSQAADLFFRNCTLPLFNTNYPEGAVCPGDYEKISDLIAKQIWSWK
jgi:hypothetical protein